MFERKRLEKIGLLSLDYGRGMFEDDDHCREIEKAGFNVLLAEDSFIHHELSASFSKLKDEEKKKLFDQGKKHMK